jgi:hypothetical protein
MIPLPDRAASSRWARRRWPATLAAGLLGAACLAGLCGCGGAPQQEVAPGAPATGPSSPPAGLTSSAGGRLSASPGSGGTAVPGTRPKKNRLGGEEP